MYIFTHLDYYWIGVPAIIITTILILYAQVLVKRYLGNDTIKKCHDVGGHYLAMVGTFYAVLLGLIVVDAMARFQQAEKVVAAEASSLTKIYIGAESFPEQKDKLQELIDEYVKETAEVEFPLMEKGEISSRATDLAFSIYQIARSIEPVTENQKAVYPDILNLFSEFLDSRRDRTRRNNFGEPAAEWVILIIGAVITIIYTFFFTMESDAIHLIMRGMAILIILMSLYLILLFGSPFSGDMKVSQEPIKMNIKIGLLFKSRVSYPSVEQGKRIPEKPTAEGTNHDVSKTKLKPLHAR